MAAAAAFSQQPHGRLLVLLLFCCLVGAATSGSTMQCHDEDQAALLAINDALGSPQHFTSWTPDTFCCDWYDVDCDNATGRVAGLTVIGDGNVTAAIPDAIANLTSLRTLVMRHLQGLTGVIPESLAQLSGLSQLTISYTGVSGPVPAFLSQLTELTLLDLSFNALTGSIPASLADLPALASIDLSRNRLEGPVPALLLSKCAGEAELWLSHNNLSGAIPAGFAAVNFTHLDLSRNSLSGDASPVLGRGKPLQHLDLSRNDFRFSLTAVEMPEGLTYLDLSHNAIRGRVPAQVADLAGLQLFNVSYNKLCNVLPTGGVMAKFDAYSYQHNKCLCGSPLPACHRRYLL
ncbi:polygalacturonase inhibitor [Setaria italica]|uniref:Leucine-rich repeat-containing N-terminal plant-type domain-containing protein n=1 Tax=Setaria italica TaxID=4555 RepID=K3Z7L9_SETIT|nr:polygalacturonase inhibitor [Setaria italica]